MEDVKSTSRRNFMKQAAAGAATVLARGSIPIAAGFSFSRAVQAQDDVALDISNKTRAILNIIPKITGFGDDADGSALRDEATRLSLEKILENQETIIESIQDINQSIEDLKRSLGSAFSEHALHDRYVEVKSFFDDLKVVFESVRENPHYFNSPAAYQEFTETVDSLVKVGSAFNSTIGITKMDHNGIALAWIAGRIANVLNQTQKNIGFLELKFLNNIPRPLTRSPYNLLRGNLQSFEEAIEHITTNLMPSAHAEQDQRINSSLENANQSVWHHVSDAIFAQPATIKATGGEILEHTGDNFIFGYKSLVSQIDGEGCQPIFDGDFTRLPEDNNKGERRGSSGNRPDAFYQTFLEAIQKITVSSTTYDFDDDGSADAIVNLDKIADISGSISTERESSCFVEGSEETVTLRPIDLLDNLPDSHVFYLGRNTAANLENKLVSEFSEWQRDILSHAQAKAYKAALTKLDSVFTGLAQHARNMDEIIMPKIQAQQVGRQNALAVAVPTQP